MADIVPSLFGLTPESYQQAQQDRADAQALQFARLSPFEKASFGIGRGAYGLAGAIGGALGGQDPELQRITMRQQIAGQIDYNDEASMKRGIAALAQSDPQGAMQLQQILLGQQAKRASIGKDEAAALASKAAAEREAKQSIPSDIQIADEISSLQERIFQFENLPATPQRDQALRLASIKLAQLERLSTKPGEKPIAANIKEVGVAETTRAPVYLDVNNNEQFTFGKDASGKQVRVPFTGGVDRTTAKTNVGVKLPAQEGKFEESLGKGQADRILADQVVARDAAEILRTNQVGRDLLSSGAITGTGANLFVGLNNALAQAGLDFGYADAAANSQAYVAAMGANVGRIIKQFGAGTGLSNADREYAAKIAAGEIALTETALRRILNINDRAANRVIDLHNKNVKDVKTNIPLTVEKPTFAKPAPPSASQIPGQSSAPAAASAPMYATNGKERIMSTDGGKTWSPVR